MSKQPLMKVAREGEVGVNLAWIEARGSSVVAITIDTATKQPKILMLSDGSNGPALHLICSLTQNTESTVVEFPRFQGWEIHCAQAGRYQVDLCLVKRKDKK